MSFSEFDASDELFVSTKQVDEFVKDHVEVFMLLYSMKAENKVVIRELPVVCEFLEVFPDNVSDLSSEREVEFTIDLVLDTSIMSVAPYKMYFLELTEIKKQLDDLLEKKFVRSGVSPWGAPILLVKKKYGSMRLCVDYR